MSDVAPMVRLPVLDGGGAADPAGSPDPGSSPQVYPNVVDDADREEIASGLSQVLVHSKSAVKFDRHDRMLYATDASIYQQEPIGVAVVGDEHDLQAATEFCDARSIAMLPRGGGTSLAGQCTNHAVVLDTSAHLRAIGAIEKHSTADNQVHASVRVQAGVVLDELNNHLARLKAGLFFPPDPATTAQATIGGCIGNNAAGSRSVKYGRMVDSVLTIDAITSSGHRLTFGPGAGRDDVVAMKLAEGVARIVRAHEQLIRERFPKTLRRNAGYALDLILRQLDQGIEPRDLDLTKLLCGSEGTLAITVGATVKLWPTPKVKGLMLVSFATVDEAIAVVPAIVATGPSAVELVDDVVIEAALNNIECRRYVEAFPQVPDSSGGQAPPGAVLYVEYHQGSEDALRASIGQLRNVVGSAPMREVLDAAGMGDAWKLRKAGEPLLHGLPGSRKPLTFVEDNAVPPERLGEFVREFRKIVQREGTRAAFWAHASVGVLHVRPLLDPNDRADMERLKRIAIEVADLAKKCGGVMSGEHGDGKVRGPLLERFYGPEIMSAFRQVKALFDPKGLLNPGNIVAPGPIESIVAGTRIMPASQGASSAIAWQNRPVVPETKTFFDYEDHHGFGGAVERCNGAGVCRKQSGGTMCPSYRGTDQERHSTRGRGNALRLAITGQGITGQAPDWQDPETIKTLDLCLSCKACKSECPSNVDIARLKAEYTAQRYKATGRIPIGALATGYIRAINRVGAIVPSVANWVNQTSLARLVINRVLKVHPKRSLPEFSESLYRKWDGRAEANAHAQGKPRVVLFADCFTTYNESSIGLAAQRVLTTLGYCVELPKVGCCGRSMISMGMLEQAIATADATLTQLKPFIDDPSVQAIVVAEPSCLSAMKDDWLLLKCKTPIELRQKLASKAMLIDEFIEKRWTSHPSSQGAESLVQSAQQADLSSVILHAHCHQKALWGSASSSKLLKRLFGERLQTPDTGCCGMAGSFGYDKDKFDLSMRIASLERGGILPIVEQNPQAMVCAPGTSCRHQIKDGAKRTALHPIELIDRIMQGSRW